MVFKVVVSARARLDIQETADYIREQASQERAKRWKNELIKLLVSLQEMPKRCPQAAEAAALGLELRELHYYSHRIIFRVQDNTVEVLRVYHSARAPLDLADLG